MLTPLQVWNSIKKYNVAIIWSAVVFLHTYAYLPYIQQRIARELKSEVSKSLTDSIKSNLINEINAKQIGFVLQLSDEMDVPMNKVPKKLAKSVLITDSAIKFYPLVDIIKNYDRIIHCGLKVDGNKLYYLSSDKTVYPCFKDDLGIYWNNNKGQKKYIE